MLCRIHTGRYSETVLFLCEESEETAKPWIEGGFSTICVDLSMDGQDVRLIRLDDILQVIRPGNLKIIGVFAMPDCTHFAASGARWWKQKGELPLLEALSLVDACLRIGLVLQSHGIRWCVVENPVGRLSRYLGKPGLTFQPSE